MFRKLTPISLFFVALALPAFVGCGDAADPLEPCDQATARLEACIPGFAADPATCTADKARLVLETETCDDIQATVSKGDGQCTPWTWWHCFGGGGSATPPKRGNRVCGDSDVLAQDLPPGDHLELAGQSIVFTTERDYRDDIDDSIYRINKGGGVLQRVFTVSRTDECLADFAVSTQKMFWSCSSTRIYRLRRGSPSSDLLGYYSLDANVADLRADDDALYLGLGGAHFDPAKNGVWRMAHDGSALAKLCDASPDIAPPLLADDDFIYYRERTPARGSAGRTITIGRVAKVGGACETLVSGVSSLSIALHGNHLYYIAGHEIYRLPKGGGSPTLLGATGRYPLGPLPRSRTLRAPTMAADGGAVYWPSHEVVARLSIADGRVSAFGTSTGLVKHVRADGRNVYWLSRGTFHIDPKPIGDFDESDYNAALCSAPR